MCLVIVVERSVVLEAESGCKCWARLWWWWVKVVVLTAELPSGISYN